MIDLLRRIRERKLVQWVLAYVAAAWITLEALDTVAGVWDWPPTVSRAVFVALVTGLLAAVVLAWYHGERGRQRVSGTELLLLTGILAAGVIVLTAVVRSEPEGGTDVQSTTPTVAAETPDLRSIAVLPFTDLSPGGDRGYLADGIAETLINGLARIDDLRVVARTSAFRFRAEGHDVREIGRELSVGAVLEGSVAQAGDRVRITAQLVDARTGLDLWSDRFDRDSSIEDLFDLQDEVAQAIVASLEIELGGAAIVSPGSRNQDAQRAYYRARQLWNARTAEDLVRAEALFLEALAADSTYAEAWAGLAETYVLFVPSHFDVGSVPAEEALDRAERAARRAIALDPTLAAPHAALGQALELRGRVVDAEAEYREAIRKNHGYATAHQWYADLLMSLGRGEEALAEIELAVSLDPVSHVILLEKAEALLVAGQEAEARAQMVRTADLFPEQLLVHWLGTWIFGVLEDWEAYAFHMARMMEADGENAAVVSRFEEGIKDPEQRRDILREIADGRTAEAGVELQTGIGSLNSPQNRFLAARLVYSDEVALEILEEAIRGQGRGWAYRPALAALMGPELLSDPDARAILDELNRGILLPREP